VSTVKTDKIIQSFYLDGNKESDDLKM